MTVAHTHAATVSASRVRFVLLALLGLVPASLVLRSPYEELTLIPLIFTGLYLLFRYRNVRDGCLKAWPVFLASALFFAWLTVGGLRFGLDGSFFGRQPAHILLCMVIAACFAKVCDMQLTWRLFSLTGIALGIFCLWQHFGLGVRRVLPPFAPDYYTIVFATVLFALALLSLVHVLFADKHRMFERIVHAVGFLLAAFAGLLTESRGPLVAFIVTLLVLLVACLFNPANRRLKLYGVALIVILIAAGGLALHKPLARGYDLARTQFNAALAGKVEGSVGMRIDMWRTAARGFLEHPWTGIGMGNARYHAFINGEIKAGRASAKIRQFDDPHNYYLRAALLGGIPGLIVILLYFLLPIVFFLKHSRSTQVDTKVASLAGLAITLLWALAVVTDVSHLKVNMALTLYSFLVTGLAVRVGTHLADDPAAV